MVCMAMEDDDVSDIPWVQPDPIHAAQQDRVKLIRVSRVDQDEALRRSYRVDDRGSSPDGIDVIEDLHGLDQRVVLAAGDNRTARTHVVDHPEPLGPGALAGGFQVLDEGILLRGRDTRGRHMRNGLLARRRCACKNRKRRNGQPDHCVFGFSVHGVTFPSQMRTSHRLPSLERSARMFN